MTRHSVTATAALFALAIGCVSLPAFAEDETLGDCDGPAGKPGARETVSGCPAARYAAGDPGELRAPRWQPDAVRRAEMPETAVRFCAAVMG